jgi:hypothetical protein
MPKGIYKRNPRISSYPLKSKLICGECSYVWEYTGVSSSTNCPICNKRIDARDKTKYSEGYARLHPERKVKLIEWWKNNKAKHSKDTTSKLKKRVFALVSKSINPICVSCGCNDLRLLEVNHKNGGGGKEYHRLKNNMNFYRDISMLRRKIDDLELLCKVCNAKHYLELKYGKLPIEVKWNGL